MKIVAGGCELAEPAKLSLRANTRQIKALDAPEGKTV
jgi:hypothetical protein